MCSLSVHVRYRINAPKVIHQIFDTEVVIVNLDSGNYYSVRGSGIQVWRQIEAGRSRAAVVNSFAGHPDAAGSIESFLDELAREELIVAADDAAGGNDTAPSAPDGFVAPVMDKFTDMQELLLLDPIHELDESGWPRRRAAAGE